MWGNNVEKYTKILTVYLGEFSQRDNPLVTITPVTVRTPSCAMSLPCPKSSPPLVTGNHLSDSTPQTVSAWCGT